MGCVVCDLARMPIIFALCLGRFLETRLLLCANFSLLTAFVCSGRESKRVREWESERVERERIERKRASAFLLLLPINKTPFWCYCQQINVFAPTTACTMAKRNNRQSRDIVLCFRFWGLTPPVHGVCVVCTKERNPTPLPVPQILSLKELNPIPLPVPQILSLYKTDLPIRRADTAHYVTDC